MSVERSATKRGVHPNDEPDILDKLDDLAKQASTEKSHYYVATVVGEAHREITRLRKSLNALRRSIQDNL